MIQEEAEHGRESDKVSAESVRKEILKRQNKDSEKQGKLLKHEIWIQKKTGKVFKTQNKDSEKNRERIKNVSDKEQGNIKR